MDTLEEIKTLARRSVEIDELKTSVHSVEEYARLVKEQMKIRAQITEKRKALANDYTKARQF